MLKRLLITGAAGYLGQLLRPMLGNVAESFRLSDMVAIEGTHPRDEVITCDLSDEAAVMDLVAGCDGILHLGGVSTEQPWPGILKGNIMGLHNLYEAARAHGHPRIIYATSNHVVGFYRQDEWLDASAPHKPDGYYGISKSFGEAVALMYFNKFGQETAMVRIGSCLPKPKDHRMLATWFSPEDFTRLIERVFVAPRLGCPVIWGISDNDAKWWDNSHCAYLGWKAQDNSARFEKELLQSVPLPDPDAPVAVYQGGVFTAEPVKKDA